MKSDLPKVLHEVCGRPMLGCVLSVCRLAGVDRMVIVVGHGREAVMSRFASESGIAWVEQREQKGTGHAVLCCRDALKDFSGNVLVIAGDMPLVRRRTLVGLIEMRERRGDAVSLATSFLDDPTGYGRIVRDAEGNLEAIVEHNECTPRQRAIEEVNPSYYCFEAERLFESLEQVEPKGAKGEYYLTEAVHLLRRANHGISGEVKVNPEEGLGVNSRFDLALVSRVMQDRIQRGLMDEGVTIVDPDNTWIESDVAIGRETIVYPFTMIQAGAIIGEGCRVGPLVRIGAGEVLKDGSSIEPSITNGVTT